MSQNNPLFPPTRPFFQNFPGLSQPETSNVTPEQVNFFLEMLRIWCFSMILGYIDILYTYIYIYTNFRCRKFNQLSSVKKI